MWTQQHQTGLESQLEDIEQIHPAILIVGGAIALLGLGSFIWAKAKKSKKQEDDK